MEKFRVILNLFLQHHSNELGYGLVTLLTAGAESIFSAAVFQCPCNAWNLPYGLVFLLVPALALVLLGCVLNTCLWHRVTGCCRRGCCTRGGSREQGSQEEQDVCMQGGPKKQGSSTSCPQCLQCTGTVLLAPVTWVAMALLEGSFYECFASGSSYVLKRLCSGVGPSCVEQLPLVPCKKALAPGVQDLLMNLNAHSQVMGWGLIALVILVLLIFISVTRCRAPIGYPQLRFKETYATQEQKIFESEIKERATKLAKENVKGFFERSDPKEHNIPSTEDWQQVSSPYTFHPEEPYYSKLHKYVSSKPKSQSSTASAGDAGLDCGDAHGMASTEGL